MVPDYVERVLSCFEGVKEVTAPPGMVRQWMARCPAHDDRNPSLSIGLADDGKIVIHDFGHCTLERILSVTGLTKMDLFPPKARSTMAAAGIIGHSWNHHRRQNLPMTRSSQNSGSSPKGFVTPNDALAYLQKTMGRKETALWKYRNAEGQVVSVAVRWDLSNPQEGLTWKEIRYISRFSDDQWRITHLPPPRLLYNLPAILKADPQQVILVVEGEKCAEAAGSLGFVATTSQGGAAAGHLADWTPLAGREVWIVPDNNDAGWKYAETVADILVSLSPPARVRIVELPGLPEGGDIVDWIQAHDAVETETLRKQLVHRAQKSDWWLPIVCENLSYRPFPVKILPEPARGFVRAGAAAIGCDPSYIALPLLVALAGAIGNTRRLELKRGWLAPAILWGAIVGDSGTAKTPAFALAMEAIRCKQAKALETHKEQMQEYEIRLALWEKEMAIWRRAKETISDPPEKPDPPQAQRYVVSDTTVEALALILLSNPRGLLLARDELAGWIGSFDRYAAKGKADAAHWLSMHNGESILVDRKTGQPRTIHVTQAAVSVCGGIQPGILRRVLTSEYREAGLAARLLLAWPEPRKKQWTEKEIDPSVKKELAAIFDRLCELQMAPDETGELRPQVVKLTPEAKDLWREYYNAHAEEQVELEGDLASAWSKLEEYAARLALVVHYVRWAAGEVAEEKLLDQESMAAGIALANWFKNEAMRVYAMLEETEEQHEQRRLLQWISRKGGQVTVRQVQRGYRRLRDPGAAENALEELVKQGLGKWVARPPGAQGGRFTRVFFLTSSMSVDIDKTSKTTCFKGVSSTDGYGGKTRLDDTSY